MAMGMAMAGTATGKRQLQLSSRLNQPRSSFVSLGAATTAGSRGSEPGSSGRPGSSGPRRWPRQKAFGRRCQRCIGVARRRILGLFLGREGFHQRIGEARAFSR
jgi:hypothetical protein